MATNKTKSHGAYDVFSKWDIGSTTIYTEDNIAPGMKEMFLANNIVNRADNEWYGKFNRFGCIDPYNSITMTKEFLFFIKPDLHIMIPGCGDNNINELNMNQELKNQPFFVELVNRYPNVVKQLQRSISPEGSSSYLPFMNILSNSVKNTLDLPAVTASEIDTSANIYGTSITYRGSGYASDEQVDFSLEFEDSKYLEVYHLIKAYEEYEKLKRLGIVSPPNLEVPELTGGFSTYVKNKELHDQFGIYKFIVDDDMESILYYAYLPGVYFKNVPRDAFSDLKEGGGIKYSIDFKSQFIFDTDPQILTDFNYLIQSKSVRGSNRLPLYNASLHAMEGRWALNPWIIRVLRDQNDNGKNMPWLEPNSMKYKYKLKWEI